MPGELGFATGPYVNIAAFCEQAIEDKDGVLTLVRIIDQVRVSMSGEDAPTSLPPGATLNTTLVISLRAGRATGSHGVKVRLEHPDGSQYDGPNLPAHFPRGENAGVNLLLKMDLALSSAGLYWADVLVNDRIVTRVPLEVLYEVIPPGIRPH